MTVGVGGRKGVGVAGAGVGLVGVDVPIGVAVGVAPPAQDSFALWPRVTESQAPFPLGLPPLHLTRTAL